MTPDEKLLKIKELLREPKGYGHCLCGRNEWCDYCNPNSPLMRLKNKIWDVINEV